VQDLESRPLVLRPESSFSNLTLTIEGPSLTSNLGATESNTYVAAPDEPRRQTMSLEEIDANIMREKQKLEKLRLLRDLKHSNRTAEMELTRKVSNFEKESVDPRLGSLAKETGLIEVEKESAEIPVQAPLQSLMRSMTPTLDALEEEDSDAELEEDVDENIDLNKSMVFGISSRSVQPSTTVFSPCIFPPNSSPLVNDGIVISKNLKRSATYTSSPSPTLKMRHVMIGAKPSPLTAKPSPLKR
jgi:hypothetical protein